MSEEQIVTVIEPKATEQEVPVKVEPIDDIITVIEPPVSPIVEDLEKETVSGSKKWDIFLWIVWIIIGLPVVNSILFAILWFSYLPIFRTGFAFIILLVLLIAPIILAKKMWKKYLFRWMMYAFLILLAIVMLAFGACIVLLSGMRL